MKFGGTSVGSAGRLRRVVEIVQAAAEEHAVVVVASAASGVTDLLLRALQSLPEETFEVEVLIEGLYARHHALGLDLLRAETLHAYTALLEERLDRLRDLLVHIRATGETPALRDEVVAEGERLSVPLVAAALRDAGLQARPQDAAPLIRTDDIFGEAVVDLETTHLLTQRWYGRIPAHTVPVVTGFIGSTRTGQTTTLGRSGSDYSAALLACMLRADALERWTDVDGLYTEDPRTHEHAKRLACIVLEEAVAWNHAGRLGMHRKALDPLVEAGIPVYVRSTAAPEEPGTVILPAGHEMARTAVAS